MAVDNHSLPDGKHNLKTPPELLEIRKAIRKGNPLPDGVASDPGVYKPREPLIRRLYRWVRPRRGCGCNKRKKWLNKTLPGLGDAIETLFKWTGVKRLVEWWTS